MGILGPRASTQAPLRRPRRRAGKNGAGGYAMPGGAGAAAAGAAGAYGSVEGVPLEHEGNDGGGYGDVLSRSAPARSGDSASLLRRAMGGLGLQLGSGGSARTHTSLEDAALREELADVSRLGQRRRRRWVRGFWA
jgi:hypothetical protein